MLVELSVMKQRYRAAVAVVQDGWKVTEVGVWGPAVRACTSGSPAIRRARLGS